MTNLKTLSVSELHQQIKNATDELIAREIECVDKPKVIEPFKTEKRNALVGEKVLITNPREGSAAVEGEIFTVTHANSGCVDVEEIKVVSSDWAFIPDEYEVLVEETPVIELQDSPPAPPKTINQQRAEINQRAREFVERKLESLKDSPDIEGGWEFKKQENPNFCHFISGVEFIVNAEKRTVVALLRHAGGVKVVNRGISKCMPDEVFNADIGKAIALARALEIIVPYEFLNAVQPDEVVAGMEVETYGFDGNHHATNSVDEVNVVRGETRLSNRGKGLDGTNLYTSFDKSLGDKIINDTNAIYEEESQ